MSTIQHVLEQNNEQVFYHDTSWCPYFYLLAPYFSVQQHQPKCILGLPSVVSLLYYVLSSLCHVLLSVYYGFRLYSMWLHLYVLWFYIYIMWLYLNIMCFHFCIMWFHLYLMSCHLYIWRFHFYIMVLLFYVLSFNLYSMWFHLLLWCYVFIWFASTVILHFMVSICTIARWIACTVWFGRLCCVIDRLCSAIDQFCRATYGNISNQDVTLLQTHSINNMLYRGSGVIKGW